MRRFKVSREPRYAGYDGPNEDFNLLVDREQIGTTYRGERADTGIYRGWAVGPGHWHSWGPAGLSLGHRSREAAEQAQVREYAANPDLADRLITMDRADREAEITRRDAERAREMQREPWERGPDAYRSGPQPRERGDARGRDSR